MGPSNVPVENGGKILSERMAEDVGRFGDTIWDWSRPIHPVVYLGLSRSSGSPTHGGTRRVA